jgi:hypothetical protein
MLVSAACSGTDAKIGQDVGFTKPADLSCFPLGNAIAPDVTELSDLIRKQLLDRTNTIRRSPTSDEIKPWLLRDLSLRGTYEDKLWAALITSHMPESPPYYPLRDELVDAMHESIVASLVAAASENGTETGTWGSRLAFDETEQLPTELGNVVLYLRGRAATGERLSSCPATLPADTGIEEALSSDNEADKKLGELATRLLIRRLNIPTEPWGHAPNEWDISVKLVSTGGNTPDAVHVATADALTSIDWFFDLFREYESCTGDFDALIPESLVDACSSETRLVSSWDPSVAETHLLEVMPTEDLREEVKTLLHDLEDGPGFHFQGYDVGAELFGYTYIVIAPADGTRALVVQLMFTHS